MTRGYLYLFVCRLRTVTRMKMLRIFEPCHLCYRPETKLREGNVFSSVCMSTGRGGLCPESSLSRGVSVQGGSLFRISLSRGISVQGFSVQGISVQRLFCPRGSLSKGSLSRDSVCPGGLCSGESLSRRVSVQEVSVQGVSVHRDVCLGGSLLWTPPSRYDGRADGTHLTGMHSCS